MANKEHLKILQQGAKVWNAWRQVRPEMTPNRKSNFLSRYLRDANLSNANLSGANLVLTDLYKTNFSGTLLRGTNLRGAYFHYTNLFGANMHLSRVGDLTKYIRRR
jgi:uncharacterized protein YjbI with pentapeptide repeats